MSEVVYAFTRDGQSRKDEGGVQYTARLTVGQGSQQTGVVAGASLIISRPRLAARPNVFRGGSER